MKTDNNTCRYGCSTYGTVLGIIFGIIVAILFSLGYTPLIISGIWVAFSIGALALLYTMFTALIDFNGASSGKSFCVMRRSRCTLIGSIGTILAAIIAVSIDLEITAAIVIALIGILTFMLIFTIASLFSYVRCLINN